MWGSPWPPLTFCLSSTTGGFRAPLVAQRVKNPPAVQETWLWSLSWEDPLEKGMATHSSILTWRIPWSEEPGGLQSVGFERVGHNWVPNTHTHTHRMIQIPYWEWQYLHQEGIFHLRTDGSFYLRWLFCVIIFLSKYHQSRSLFLVSAVSQLSIVHLPSVLFFS